MPLASSYLRPDFEYVGAAPRKLGLALAFIVAGASGIAGFIADSGPDADPMTARALAPVETLGIAINDAPAAPAQSQATEAVFAQNLSKTGGSKPLCQQTTAQDFSRDCPRGKAHKPRSVEVVKEGPAIAAVQVGGPALLPLKSTIPIGVTPDGPDGSAKRATAEPATDAAPVSAVVESLTPADSVKKPRARNSHVQRRDRNAYSRSRHSYRNYYQNGYARVW